MKKHNIIFFLLALLSTCLFFNNQALAKEKKVELNKTNLTIKKGKTFQLKLKNAKSKKVKWTVDDNYTVTLGKRGKVKAKNLGNTTITASYNGKKYRCKVRVCSVIDADKIHITYANDIFTKKVLKQLKRIETIKGNIKDPAAMKYVFSKMAAWKLTKSQNSEPGTHFGYCYCNLVLKSGEKITVTWGEFFIINDIRYERPADFDDFDIFEVTAKNKE